MRVCVRWETPPDVLAPPEIWNAGTRAEDKVFLQCSASHSDSDPSPSANPSALEWGYQDKWLYTSTSLSDTSIHCPSRPLGNKLLLFLQYLSHKTTWMSSLVKFPHNPVNILWLNLSLCSLSCQLHIWLQSIHSWFHSLINTMGIWDIFPACNSPSIPPSPCSPTLSISVAPPLSPSLTHSFIPYFFHASTDTVDLVYSRPLTLG